MEAGKQDIPFQKLDVYDVNPNPEYMVRYAKQNGERGNPDTVIKAIDDFCSKYARRAMNLGDEKGRILDEIFKDRNPDIALELGSFMGYSAVRMARLLKPGGRLYCIEINPDYAKLAKETVEFAGLSEKVVFIVASSDSAIDSLRQEYGIEKIDFVFVDHMKNLYKPDTIKLVETGLLKNGSVMAADNVLYPGAPEYLEYVRNHPKFKSVFFESHLEYRPEIKDGIEKSVFLG